MSVGRVLKSYIWWTHDRGSVHYDVMVTLILAFIFLTPHFWNYGERPKPDWPANEIRASLAAGDEMVYEVPVSMVHPGAGATGQALHDAIAPISGPIAVDRWEAVKEIGGRVIGWRVWGHRTPAP